MTTYVGAAEAARLLGVSKPTLYAYVSRGMLGRRTAVDGRTSLYDREQVELLANRSRRRPPAERPTIDVQIVSAITQLHDDGLTFRGHDAIDLARRCSFEQVAELLWTGSLPLRPPVWDLDRVALDRCRAVAAAAETDDPVIVLALCASTLASDAGTDDATTAARRLLAIIPSVLGGPMRGDIAHRLASAWRRQPSPELVDAIGRALVLLSDHGLATSTLGVRVACSVRADPYSSIATGLHVVRGPMHGAAGAALVDLLDEAAGIGASQAIRGRLARHERLPGFGHAVYRGIDPRLPPLLEAVRSIPGSDGRSALVDEVLSETGRLVGRQPNVDFGLGALLFVAGLPRDTPVFAIARIAGWAAHHAEESSERPVRYRGLARPRVNDAARSGVSPTDR